MRRAFKIILCSVLILAVLSCKKKRLSIRYNDNIYFGTNILSLSDGPLQSGTVYGMGAEIGTKASLKVVITNLSLHTNTSMPAPVWLCGENKGWDISNYDNSTGTQTFTATHADKIDVALTFDNFGQQGLCRVECYENSKYITRTKNFSW